MKVREIGAMLSAALTAILDFDLSNVPKFIFKCFNLIFGSLVAVSALIVESTIDLFFYILFLYRRFFLLILSSVVFYLYSDGHIVGADSWRAGHYVKITSDLFVNSLVIFSIIFMSVMYFVARRFTKRKPLQ